MGLVLMLVAVLGPLSLYRCRMMDVGLSLEPQKCCASKRDTPTVQGAHRACCERVKAATPQVPAVANHLVQPLEQSWAPAWGTLFVIPALEPPTAMLPPPTGRGPPVRPRTPPVFLLNASFLC